MYLSVVKSHVAEELSIWRPPDGIVRCQDLLLVNPIGNPVVNNVQFTVTWEKDSEMDVRVHVEE